ncbi:MAG: phosphatase PAP2 family protein [Cellvibrio sp.]
MTMKDRIIHMLWSWGTVGLIYGTTRFMPGERWIIPETWVETQIPFSASGIWLYLAFFLFVPWAFLSAPENRILKLRYAIQISAVISGIVFILFPTSLAYPTVPEEGFNAKALEILLIVDTAQNCLPSLHAALTFLALVSLWNWKNKFLSIFYLTIALLIGFSIIQLRRHLFIDVTAGLLAGLISLVLAKLILTRTISNGARNHE